MHLLPPIQIPHPAPYAHPPSPHSTNNETNPHHKSQMPIRKFHNHNKTIKQLIVSHQHQRIKPNRKSQEQSQNINKVKAKLSQSQLFKRIR